MKENKDSPSIRTELCKAEALPSPPQIIIFREALQSIHLVLKR